MQERNVILRKYLKNTFILHNNLKHFDHHLWQNLEMDSVLLSFLSVNVTTFVAGPSVSFRCAPNVLRTFFLVLRFNDHMKILAF